MMVDCHVDLDGFDERIRESCIVLQWGTEHQGVDLLQDSRWVVGTLDVIPVEIALPEGLGTPGPDQPIDWQV